jgi:hypothetical protein
MTVYRSDALKKHDSLRFACSGSTAMGLLLLSPFPANRFTMPFENRFGRHDPVDFTQFLRDTPDSDFQLRGQDSQCQFFSPRGPKWFVQRSFHDRELASLLRRVKTPTIPHRADNAPIRQREIRGRITIPGACLRGEGVSLFGSRRPAQL